MSMLKLFVPLLGLTTVLGMSACSNEENGEGDQEPQQEEASELASESASASAAVEANTIDLTCPDPIGAVQVTHDEADPWSTAYVVGSEVALSPVAYGEVVFTDSGTGQTTTTSPVTKEGADTTGAIECTFTDDVDEEGKKGTVNGTVMVVQP